MVEYCCPKCHGALSRGENEMVCTNHCQTWPVLYGIPHFGDSSFYWGFVPKEQMPKVLACAEEQGWQEAVQQVSSGRSDASWFQSYLTDERRASWSLLAGVSDQSRVLDIGSGWGATVFGLARIAKEVVAFDATSENLRFIDIRRTQMGMHNVHPVQGDLIFYPYLPFPDNYFDVISMVGVLEWLGDAVPDLDPTQVQIQVLDKVRAVLKPDCFAHNEVRDLGLEIK